MASGRLHHTARGAERSYRTNHLLLMTTQPNVSTESGEDPGRKRASLACGALSTRALAVTKVALDGAREANDGISDLPVAGLDPSPGMLVVAKERGWLPVMGVDLTEEEISQILEEAEDVLDSYIADDGRVTFDAPAHLVSARKP